jgi:SAM-dependent methyltransferase
MTEQEHLNSVYNEHARAMQEKFVGIGARTEDVARAFELAGNPQSARVVEIGCGDGRDAREIIPRTTFYEGFDPAEGMLKIAHEINPGAGFVVADVRSYIFPENLNIVFAFASLLHVPKEDLLGVMSSVHDSLVRGGVFYLSMKIRPAYTAEVKHDQFGERMFYHYTEELLVELAGIDFDTVYTDHQGEIRGSEWLTIAFKK